MTSLSCWGLHTTSHLLARTSLRRQRWLDTALTWEPFCPRNGWSSCCACYSCSHRIPCTHRARLGISRCSVDVSSRHATARCSPSQKNELRLLRGRHLLLLQRLQVIQLPWLCIRSIGGSRGWKRLPGCGDGLALLGVNFGGPQLCCPARSFGAHITH